MYNFNIQMHNIYIQCIICIYRFHCIIQIFKLDLEKAEETRDQIANICWITEKAKKYLHFFIDYAKAFGCVDHNKVWKILKEMGIPAHLTCLLRNLYAGQEAS